MTKIQKKFINSQKKKFKIVLQLKKENKVFLLIKNLEIRKKKKIFDYIKVELFLIKAIKKLLAINLSFLKIAKYILCFIN